MFEITVRFMGERLEYKSDSAPFVNNGLLTFTDNKTGRRMQFHNCETMVCAPREKPRPDYRENTI